MPLHLQAGLNGHRVAGLLGLRVVHDKDLETRLENRVVVLALVRQGLPDLRGPAGR